MGGFESVVEQAALDWLQELGWTCLDGQVAAPDGSNPQRAHYREAILERRLRDALARLNPHLPESALDDAARKVLQPAMPTIEENNRTFRRFLTRGVEVQVSSDTGPRGDLAWLVDFANADNNDWLAINQFTVDGGKNKRRPDIVLFVNGLPIAVIEAKSPDDPTATIRGAWNQLQTYKAQVPVLFNTNELLVISDGFEAKVGSLTAGFERFGPWRTIDGSSLAPDADVKLRVLIHGLFERGRLLDYLRHFAFWEAEDGLVKKIAGYHQFHAVNKAVAATVRAAGERGDGRIGVIWHTQGSGKSVAMALYAGKVILEPAMANPTLVVITDRNDLDGQLFGQFARTSDLLPAPVQAESREHLRELLTVASGGLVFSTIQKFGTPHGVRMPVLSDRRNIVVIADEAHRSHYEFIEGFARNLQDALPNASVIGFTGTPIEFDDKSTTAVFGDLIDTYTITQSVEDRMTVPIFYEARLARIDLPESEKPRVDQEFEEITEGEEETSKERLKSTWAKVEALVGTEKRLALIAKDIVQHWESRTEVLAGKGMIVGMSRRICVELYEQIIKLRPEWHSANDGEGAIKVVMTGAASDPAAFQPHVRNKASQKAIERRFKDPADALQLVIVRDMWLTGFDVPCAHTLYVDKPMKGHTLMQAIARVNRVFGDKPGGLVVDYLGLAEQLRKAVGTYGGRKGERPGIPVEEALRVLFEKHEVVSAMFHGFDFRPYFTGTATQQVETLKAGADHVLSLEDGKRRYLDAMAAFNKAVGLALHLEDARRLRDDVEFFQRVEGSLRKYTTPEGGRDREDLSAAIRQIVSSAVASEGVIDIFQAAGLRKPDISILSDQFLETVRASPYRNLQLELLKKLLADEIRAQMRRNVVRARRFSEMLEKSILAYQNRSLEAAQVILELIELAKEMRDAPKRGAELGLSEDEMAFYDALVAHGGVRDVMGDDVLAAIAHDLVEGIRQSVTIDWTQKETVRAQMRAKVKRLLRKHGYPPDKQEAAVITVIEQAEQVCREWGEVA